MNYEEGEDARERRDLFELPIMVATELLFYMDTIGMSRYFFNLELQREVYLIYSNRKSELCS